jgi:diguanylate cyclase (GGDEF)-like protein
MCILVIDSDDAAAAHVKGLLADDGHSDVEIVASIGDALRWLESDGPARRAPTLILTSASLPDGSGLELCGRLRRTQRFEDVPIVVVSATADERALEEALDAGACDFLHKPVRSRELAARVRAALRAQRNQQASSSRADHLLGVAERLRKSNEVLMRLSSTDPLTKVANRRQLNVAYRREWRRASRVGQPLAIVMFDVDDFHVFNVRNGHLAGDGCLTAIAGALADCGRRPTDLLARYGGEEFTFVLPDTDLDGARRVAERCRESVAALGIVHAGSRCADHVTVSAGVASLTPRPDLSPEVLLSAADDALLRAKRLGRDRVEVSDGESSGSIVILVEVDPIIAPRVPTFLANRRRDVQVLRDAVDRDAFDSIQRVAHNLKGIGASYGFEPISEVGRRIEDAAHTHDAAAIRAAVTELDQYLDRVRVAPPAIADCR